MDGRYIEPREVIWAVAEITGEDDSGTSFRVPAVLEDTSRSGACVRLKRPLAVGSRITIRWHREQFPAIARNCRTDGGEFLLGVRQETEIVSATKSASHRAAIDANPGRTPKDPAEAAHAIAAPAQTLSPAEAAPAVPKPTPAPSRGQSRQPRRRNHEPRLSGYGIHKVVDMLNNDRIRDLSNDAKRASVFMALDADGMSTDETLTDATRRQNALTSYETAQSKQLEDFEARKAKENTRIEEEMEKIRIHYAQRVQANLDQVAKEKEALRNWQMAMQHETQRIAEVIELCGKQPEPERSSHAMAAARWNCKLTEIGIRATRYHEPHEAPAPRRT